MISVKFGGEGKILMNLQALSTKGIGKAQADIIYDTPYAAKIHEDLEMYHSNGEAKFLEKAYRRNLASVKDYMKIIIRNKMDLKDAVKEGATIILRESNKLVPVDTGRLKESGKVIVRSSLV